jgi:hypothetical protein
MEHPRGNRRLEVHTDDTGTSRTYHEGGRGRMLSLDTAEVAVLALGPGSFRPFEVLPAPEPIYTSGPGDQHAAVAPRRYLKDLIATGEYKHPKLGWTLDTDGARMGRWCKAFSKMQENGVKVPIYADHNPGAESCLGYLCDVFRGGDPKAFARNPGLFKLPPEKMPLDPKRLYGVHEFADDTSESVANRVGQVSVLIDKAMKDGKGNDYGEAIRHVAVTPEPVVGGQSGFVRLAASRVDEGESDEAGVFVLTIGEVEEPGTDRKVENKPMTPEELAGLAGLLPENQRAGVTGDNILARLQTHVGGLVQQHGDLRQQLAASTLAPEVEDMLVEGAEDGLDGLVACGHILPATRDKLVKALIGEAGHRNAYALSRTVSKTPTSLVKQVIDALKDNDPVKLGEQTKGQHKTLALSRQTPGAGDTAADPKVTESMVNMAGGAQK